MNYVQSANFDHNTETLYWFQCYSTTAMGLYTVNTTTGAATLVQAGMGEITSFFVPFEYNPGPTPGTGGDPVQEPRESEIVWSNCLDKDMYLTDGDVTVNVLLNSADSPEGVQVTFTNYNEAEQEMYPIDPIVLDETGYYAFESFRKGEYKVNVEFDGYEPIEDSVSIWDATDLRYVMIEIIYGVSDLYVSSTGWAMWGAEGMPTPGGGGGGGGGGTSGNATVILTAGDIWGDGTGYQMLIDADATAYGTTIPTTGALSTACSGNDAIYSQFEYKIPVNADGNCSTTNIVYNNSVSIEVPAGVYDWCITNPTPGDRIWIAASNGNVGGRQDDYEFEAGKTYEFTISMYGTNDGVDVTISGGSKGGNAPLACGEVKDMSNVVPFTPDYTMLPADAESTRHLEYYKVMCESLDHEPIFNANVPADQPFCQVNTDELVPGDHYICKVAAMYSTGMSGWTECEWQYIPCTEYAGTVSGIEVEGNTVSWEYPGGGVLPPEPPVPGDDVTVTLNVPTDIWGDGSGYQMLLDADHNAYGTTIPETGALSTNCSGNEAIYAEFEYKIPVDADGNCSTTHMVNTNSVTITIPAGTYDWCITNPTPGDRIWIAAANGNVGGRQNDYVFEGGRTYTFTISMYGSNDGVDVTISGGAKNAYAPLACGEVRVLEGAKGGRAMWDRLGYFSCSSAGQQGVATDGQNIYTCSWQASPAGGYTFYKYTMDGTFVEGFNISGVTELRDLTYDGQYFYAGKGTSVLYCLDLANHTLIGQTTTTCSAIRHCSYDPVNDGFWVGNWSDLKLVDRGGATLTNGPALESAYGSGYYDNHLYLFTQTNGYGQCTVYDYDILANSLSSSPVMNLNSLPGFDNTNGLSGGAFIGQYGDKTAFFGNVQQEPNLVGIYEIAEGTPGPVPPTPAGDVLGAMSQLC